MWGDVHRDPVNWRHGECAGTTALRHCQRRLTGRESLLTPSWWGLRTFSSRRISENFQQCSLLSLLILSLLPSSSWPSKPLLLMLKSQQGLERVRRFNHRSRPNTPRTLSQSEMWSPRLKMQSLSPRYLIPKRTLIKPRHNYRIFFCSFLYIFLLFCSGILPLNITYFLFYSMKRLFLLLYVSLLYVFLTLSAFNFNNVANSSELLLFF